MILGADLSYTRTGLVWLDDSKKVVHFQAITIKRGHREELRSFHAFAKAVDGRIPSLAVIENQWSKSLIKLVVLMVLVLQAHDVKIKLAYPSSWRKQLFGSGKLTKPETAKKLKRAHGISFKDDPGHDLSDAACLAVWGLKR